MPGSDLDILMPGPNQKHMVPRYPDGTPLAMRRSHFLDSTQKCFFGPGQRPDSGDQTGINNDVDVVQKEYTPPLDWPGSGMLLRVPQVVFLRRQFFSYGGGGGSADFSGGIPTPSINYWTDFHTGFWSVFGTSGGFQVGLPGLPVVEDYRIAAIFAEVAETISALRPGRTFVTHFDADYIVDGWGNVFVPPDQEIISKDMLALGMDNTLVHMLAPPLTETQFFGTDFLHVYAGLPAAFTNPVAPLNLSGFVPVVGLNSDPVLSNNLFFTGSLGRLTAASPLFRRYAVWIWTDRVDEEGIDFHSLDMAPITDIVVHDPYPLTAVPTSDPNPYTALPYSAAVVANPTDLRAQVVTKLEDLNVLYETAGEYLREMCDGAPDLGIQFFGPSSLIISANDIVVAIAAHFGFDPVTGKDL